MTQTKDLEPSVTVLAGTIRDLDGIMPVMQSAFDPAHGEAWTLAQCSGIMSLPGSWLFLAYRDQVIVGFGFGRTIAGEAELLLIGVDKIVQRSGIGHALMTMLIDHLHVNGVSKLHLEVRSNNKARVFYEEFGFSCVGLRKNYYRGAGGSSTDALTLSRDIQ